MEWLQVLAIIGGIVGPILGVMLPLHISHRNESKADLRKMDSKIDENRREANTFLMEMKSEMKDFHGRMCAIEERYRSKG